MSKMLSVMRLAGPMAMATLVSVTANSWMALEMRRDDMVRDIAMQNRIHPNQGICRMKSIITLKSFS
jgi:hypothetical protein